MLRFIVEPGCLLEKEMAMDGKTAFAQTSSSVERNWARHKLDMKGKAIVELEFMPLLQQMLVERFEDHQIAVRKHGAGSELWFNTGNSSTDAPDYEATFSDGTSRLYEFQFADKPGLPSFDFKASKIRRKVRGKNEYAVHREREFFYVARHEKMVGFVSPQWIYDNGEYGMVSAWKSQAYRVPREAFLNHLGEGDGRLAEILEVVEGKKYLLEFQHGFLSDQKDRLSSRLGRVVDEKEKFEIAPNTIKGLFETCLIMSSVERSPDDPDIWLIYLLTHLEKEDLTPFELAMIAFSIDFLYFGRLEKTSEFPTENRIYILRGIDLMESHIQRFTWNQSSIDSKTSLLEQVRQMLFVVSQFEDWRQHVAHAWDSIASSDAVRKARRIFEDIPDPMALKHWVERHSSRT